jgi:GNAT superfamily N-acetyltransferase
MKIVRATDEDKVQLMDFFKHYDSELLERRIDCFLSHNITLLAIDEDEIVGTLQWQVKEDPDCGVAEFEEFHVLEDHRGKGVGSLLLEHGIRSVKGYFQEHGIEPRRIFAFVGKERETAKHTFEKHGFKPVSEVGNLLSDSEIDMIYIFEV